MVSAAFPVSSSRSTPPEALSLAVSPLRSSGNTHELPALAECRTTDSFTPEVIGATVRSVSGRTDAYVTVEPEVVP